MPILMVTNVFEKDLGKKIRELRKQKGISQQQLAESIGKSQIMISYYERGERPIYVDDLRKIANSLEVSIHIFFEENDYSLLLQDLTKVKSPQTIALIHHLIKSIKGFYEDGTRSEK